MSFYVLKKTGDDVDGVWSNRPPYKGKTTLYDGLLYFATSKSLPTEFDTKKETQEAIDTSKVKWPNDKFRIVEAEEEKKKDE